MRDPIRDSRWTRGTVGIDVSIFRAAPGMAIAPTTKHDIFVNFTEMSCFWASANHSGYQTAGGMEFFELFAA